MSAATWEMAAVVPVRDGVLPAGSEEATAEAAGRALLVGSGTRQAGKALGGHAEQLLLAELGEFAPGAWARALSAVLDPVTVVVLPASPDGRDLAPRLAAAMVRPLVAGATEVRPGGATVVRHGGRVAELISVDAPFVATLVPGARGVPDPPDGPAAPVVGELELAPP
ncbi:MAG: hypothetical protein ACRDPK_05425, partial [Carbonactinosporaceae bacterium]